MLPKVKERLEGPEYNIDFGWMGWGRQGKGIGMSTMEEGAILRKCLNTFVPHWDTPLFLSFLEMYWTFLSLGFRFSNEFKTQSGQKVELPR